MAKRQIVAVTGTSPSRDTFPLALLYAMHEHLARAIDEVYLLTYHRLDRHDYRFRHQPGSTQSLKEAIDFFYPNGDFDSLRAVLSQTPMNLDFDPGSDHKHLIYSSNTTYAPSWNDAPSENISNVINLPAGRMGDLVFDLLLDISFANSDAIRPVIARYLKEHSRKSLYKLKTDFYKSKKLGPSPVYGAISSRAQYISFAAVARKNNSLVDSDHLIRTAAFWNEFTNNYLADFRADSKALAEELRNIPHYGKQISPRILKLDKIKAGNLLIIRPRSSSRSTTTRLNGLATTFRISKWSPRHSFAISEQKIRSNESLRKTLNVCVRDDLAMVFRMYYRG